MTPFHLPLLFFLQFFPFLKPKEWCLTGCPPSGLTGEREPGAALRMTAPSPARTLTPLRWGETWPFAECLLRAGHGAGILTTISSLDPHDVEMAICLPVSPDGEIESQKDGHLPTPTQPKC